MIIYRGLYHHIGDYKNQINRGIPINQPGLNGIIEGFISHCSTGISIGHRKMGCFLETSSDDIKVRNPH